MFGGLFAPKYNSVKCKTALGISLGRIKLLQNKKAVQVKTLRREIASLLSSGKDESARIRVEAVMRELSMITVLEILELFVELISVRLQLIGAKEQCPLDLREAVATVIYTSTRTEELPDLAGVRKQFTIKYGKEFIEAIVTDTTALSSGVNQKVFDKLAIRAPKPEDKVALLQEIAVEHGLEWNPKEADTSILGAQPENLMDFDEPDATVTLHDASGSSTVFPLTPQGVPPSASQPGPPQASTYTPPSLADVLEAPPQTDKKDDKAAQEAAAVWNNAQEAAAAAVAAAQQASDAAQACAKFASMQVGGTTRVKGEEEPSSSSDAADISALNTSESNNDSLPDSNTVAPEDLPDSLDVLSPPSEGSQAPKLPDFLKPGGATNPSAPAAVPPAPPAARPATTAPAPQAQKPAQPPPSAPAANTFDDLSKRFEALKNRR